MIRSLGVAMSKRPVLLALCLIGIAGVAAAAQLKMGDTFPQLSLSDQHDQVIKVSQDTRTMLFAADMASSDLLKDFLAKQAPDFLVTNRAEYIADISGMPGLITRWVALPRMREEPYRILLAKDAGLVAFIPREEAAVTVIHLRDAQVEAIGHARSETELAHVFD